MSTNTRIELPLTCTSEHIAKVCAKLVGTPWRADSFDEWDPRQRKNVKRVFDETQPPSPENPWHLRFERGFEPKVLIEPTLTGHILFWDVLKQKQHHWFYMPEHFYGEWDCKCLIPDSTALAVAVGRRLNAFFGGRFLAHSDRDGEEALWQEPASATLPPRVPNNTHGDEDGRWYQFETALFALEPLTGQEIRDAAEVSGYGLVDGQEALAAALDADRIKRELQKNLTEPAVARRPPRI